MYRSTTGGLSSIRSYRSCSWGRISILRQPSRGLSGNVPPPLSSLSCSVPSRHLFGAVAIYYRRSLQHPIVQKLLLRKYFLIRQPSRDPSGNASPHEFSLGFGTIKASFRHCGDLLPEASPVFDRTEVTLGEVFPSCASLPEVSLEMRPPREFSLGFGTIKALFWCCSDLLPVVSPVYDRTEATL